MDALQVGIYASQDSLSTPRDLAGDVVVGVSVVVADLFVAGLSGGHIIGSTDVSVLVGVRSTDFLEGSVPCGTALAGNVTVDRPRMIVFMGTAGVAMLATKTVSCTAASGTEIRLTGSNPVDIAPVQQMPVRFG